MTVAGAEQRPQAGEGIALRLDAQQAIERLREDIEHFAALDPNVAWVRDAVRTRCEEIPENDVTRVTTLAWPSLKAKLLPDVCPLPGPIPIPTIPNFCLNIPKPDSSPGSTPPRPKPWPWFCIQLDDSTPRPFLELRHGLVEGDVLRRLAESELSSGSLTADALRKTARAIADWEYASESAHTREFDRAHDEVKRLTLGGPERKAPSVVAAAVFVGMIAGGAFVIAALYPE